MRTTLTLLLRIFIGLIRAACNLTLIAYHQAQANKKKRRVITALNHQAALARAYRASRNQYPFHS